MLFQNYQCSAGALISQGDFYTNVSTACTSLGDTYAYCYLEVPEGFTAIYHSSLSAEATCGTPTILNSGDCAGAGSWISYEMIYSA